MDSMTVDVGKKGCQEKDEKVVDERKRKFCLPFRQPRSHSSSPEP